MLEASASISPESGYRTSGSWVLENNSALTIEEIDIAYSQIEQSSVLRIYMATWACYREHAPLQKYMMAGPWDRDQFKHLCKKHPDLSKDMESLYNKWQG
jgi:hypothetical protein